MRSFNPKKVFFIADTHFGDRKVLKHFNRPFKDVKEMDKTMIDNWNKVVKKRDVVFHLGDFASGNFESWKEIVSRLNGKIYLIRGNHDHRDNEVNREKLLTMFKDVNALMYIKVGDLPILLNHYPFLCYAGSYENQVWDLHGHTHQNNNMKGFNNSRLSYRFPTQYDVGVDNNNFTPISYEKVKEIINKQIEENI